MDVLFNSSRPLGRCENLTAVYEAFDGPKRFVQGGFADVSRHPCDVVVTDEFVRGKRDGQTVVMIEHGITGGKLYGLEQPHGVYTPDACRLVDWFVVTGEDVREIGARSAGIPVERCLALGLPRTDAYFGKRKGDGGTFLAGFPRAYLFAPTFRASWEPEPPEIDWAAIDASLDDDEILVVKRHMIAREPLLPGRFAHIAEVSPDDPSTPYLIDCDVVMTDYSSIMLDGYVLGKPCMLYCPDWDGYREARGMALGYPRGYSDHWIARDYDELVPDMLRRAHADGMGPTERACLELTAGACDGHSTERVVDLVRGLA